MNDPSALCRNATRSPGRSPSRVLTSFGSVIRPLLVTVALGMSVHHDEFFTPRKARRPRPGALRARSVPSRTCATSAAMDGSGGAIGASSAAASLHGRRGRRSLDGLRRRRVQTLTHGALARSCRDGLGLQAVSALAVSCDG
jgi:hypothetical protein